MFKIMCFNKTLNKTLAFIFILIIITIFIYIIFISIFDSIYSPQVNVIEINSSKSEKLYLKQKVWGITWDHEVVVVSDSPETDFIPDSTKEYVYKGSSGFFYKFKDDTLTLYVNMNSRVPDKLSTRIKINQVVMGSYYLRELNSTYKSKGLEKFELQK